MSTVKSDERGGPQGPCRSHRRWASWCQTFGRIQFQACLRGFTSASLWRKRQTGLSCVGGPRPICQGPEQSHIQEKEEYSLSRWTVLELGHQCPPAPGRGPVPSAVLDVQLPNGPAVASQLLMSQAPQLKGNRDYDHSLHILSALLRLHLFLHIPLHQDLY